MANPTSNFGWQMPTNTDLVKDLPADFEVFGQAVDTSLMDLKGGTTGQVLSKASNTDMDFTWVTSDDANAIQNAIVDAKGDLIAASAADTPARLAVGNNGETLVADSSTSTGLRWQPSVVTNAVIGGSFDIWQRGTSFNAASNNTYTADRWTAGGSGNALTVSRQLTSDTTNLPTILYCARVQRDSGNTSTADRILLSNIENANCQPFIGQTITFSFYARKGADFSAASSNLTVRLTTGTGTDQSAFSGLTGASNAINSTATLTTTWQRFSFTVTLSASITQFVPSFRYTPVGTAGAADYFEVTGVQIELGSVATVFKRSGGTLAGELQAAQRYYFRANAVPSQRWGMGKCDSTTVGEAYVAFPVQMRIAPTALEQNGTASDYKVSNASGTGVALSAVPTFATATVNGAAVSFTVASGLTAGNATVFYASTNSPYLGWSAEL